jgi:hypothetical protein
MQYCCTTTTTSTPFLHTVCVTEAPPPATSVQTHLQACFCELNGCCQHCPDAARDAACGQLLAHVQVPA